MSIEATLTLILAACILLGAALVRMSVFAAIRLFVIVREWVRPATTRHADFTYSAGASAK